MSDGQIYYDSSSGMSTHSHMSHSTPFKVSSRTGNSKPIATEERSHIRISDMDNSFLSTHFSSPTSLSITADDSIKQSLLELEQELNETQLYGLLANIFDKVASSVCGLEPMLFHPSRNVGPSGASRQEDRSLVPDFSILPRKQISAFAHKDKSGKLRIPWSTLESFVEVKTKKRWAHRQAIDYIETLLQYRPDKVYVLGMSCNQQLYQFYYADACVQKSSPVFRWKEGLNEFVQFVHSLHCIYKEDTGRDKSYTLHDVTWQQDINASARWRVSFGGKTNEVQRMFARKGTGRRTWLGIGQEINDSSTGTNTSEKDRIRIVKDMWRDKSRRFMESEILNQIHKDGYVAGVVRHISAGPVNELTVADPLKGDRLKERVVMASTGLRLSACESVLDFLKVMYDLVETHEQLLEKRDILHRDISWYNVLCKPEHFIGHDKVAEHATIGKILRKRGKEREPLCLLTDFDTASLTKETDPKGAAERTGTPMFIACELSYGSFADQMMRHASVITPNQLSLEGDVLEAYIEVYGQQRYNKYETWLQSVISRSGKASNHSFIASHQPHHDMESVYWLILWFIIKAWPTAVELKPNTPDYGHNLLKDLMLNRQIDDKVQAVVIVPLLQHDESTWGNLLNPVYRPLFGMLINMGQYLCMRWSEFPVVHTWHAHEAFKRLLLKEIIRMTNDNCPIPIKGPRPPPPKYFSSQLLTTNGSQISSCGPNPLEPQSLGSKKRQDSTPSDSEPPPKRPRRMRTTNILEENPNPLAKFVENLANDALWFL